MQSFGIGRAQAQLCFYSRRVHEEAILPETKIFAHMGLHHHVRLMLPSESDYGLAIPYEGFQGDAKHRPFGMGVLTPVTLPRAEKQQKSPARW